MENKVPVKLSAMLHGVPKSTLQDRVTGRISLSARRSGPPPIFSPEQESRLVSYIQLMTKIGYGVTKPELITFLSDYAMHIGKRKAPLGSWWMGSFLSRWVSLPILPSHRRASKECMNAYYEELSAIVQRHDLPSSSIFIISEKVLCLEHAHPCVLNTSLKRNFQTSAGGSKSLTLIAGASASGSCIPPFFVLPDGIDVSAVQNTMPGVGVWVSHSGSSDSEPVKEYISNHIQEYVTRAVDTDHVLVLYDGPKCLIPFEVQEVALEGKMILFKVPPPGDHEEDEAEFFHPLSEHMMNHFRTFLTDHPESSLTAESVCQLACKAYSEALSVNNIKNSFQLIGISG